MVTDRRSRAHLKQQPDSGCDVHPSCFTCPLEICIFDLRQGRQELEHNQRREKAQALRAAGAPNDAIAVALGISSRTVTRLTN